MLAVQQIKILWSKESRNPEDSKKRKYLFFPSLIRIDNQQDQKEIFLTCKGSYYFSRSERDFWYDYYKSQNLYRRSRKRHNTNPGDDFLKGTVFDKTDEAADRTKRWDGLFYTVEEINKNIIPCIRIQKESNAYRIKWFSQDSPFMKPFRRGGNEDVNDPASEFYKQFNTLNETAFVLSDGQSGEIRFNYRSLDIHTGVHICCEVRIYMVNTDHLTEDLFVREYDYTYKQLVELY